MCYTYDELSRVTSRTVKKLSDNSVVSTETFNYDAAGNITDAPDSCFQYDTNNRLISFNGNAVSYDLDGNMLSNGSLTCTYDSANRLVSAGGHTYAYNAEDVRIRNLCEDKDTTYTYNTNAKLSMLLMKTTNGVVTKYVYGKVLIGEEVSGAFKTYHFDCRGSTIAITDASGNITDTFAYDTYGKVIARTGTSKVIFTYNGRDGVVTDDNGLIYMRARYYSPEMKRFINADIVAGKLSNAVTLNRFAYANGNPVSFVDPFGLSADNKTTDVMSDEEIESEIHYHLAIYVSNFNYSFPINYTGHTQLYLLGSDEKWYFTEFNSYSGDGIKDIKSNAQIYWEKRTPPMYDASIKAFIEVPGVQYVVLTGNFDKGAKLAQKYANSDYNGYNFLLNNCSDYTDELLDVSNVDGLLTQAILGDDTMVSIPGVRVMIATLADRMDDPIRSISDGFKKAGNVINDKSFALGSFLINTGYFIEDATNLIGDVLGETIKFAVNITGSNGKSISNKIKKVWDKIVSIF